MDPSPYCSCQGMFWNELRCFLLLGVLDGLVRAGVHLYSYYLCFCLNCNTIWATHKAGCSGVAEMAIFFSEITNFPKKKNPCFTKGYSETNHEHNPEHRPAQFYCFHSIILVVVLVQPSSYCLTIINSEHCRIEFMAKLVMQCWWLRVHTHELSWRWARSCWVGSLISRSRVDRPDSTHLGRFRISSVDRAAISRIYSTRGCDGDRHCAMVE